MKTKGEEDALINSIINKTPERKKKLKNKSPVKTPKRN